MTEQPFRHRWRDLVKSYGGPDDPMLRLVLLVLGDWSPVEGGPFSVKNSILAEQTGLSVRPLRYRLKQAEGVWFTRERASRGRPYRYRLRIPTAIDVARSLEEVRGDANRPWAGDVENSEGCGSTQPDPGEEGAAPRSRTSGSTQPHWCGSSQPDIDVQIHTPDVARPGSSSVENLDPGAPNGEGGDQLEIARLILEAVKGGRHEDFEAASELLAERKRQQKAADG